MRAGIGQCNDPGLVLDQRLDAFVTFTWAMPAGRCSAR
jgi:hypothetical protein